MIIINAFIIITTIIIIKTLLFLVLLTSCFPGRGHHIAIKTCVTPTHHWCAFLLPLLCVIYKYEANNIIIIQRVESYW